MARRSLGRQQVVEAAAGIADSRGLEHLNLRDLASALNVKPPSLYNHVEGLSDLQEALTLYGLERLNDRLTRAAVGKAGPDALRAIAYAYRDFASAHPGLHEATLRTVEDRSPDIKAAGQALLELLLSALQGFDFEGDDALHAVRSLRAALGGFVMLERAHAFGMDLSVDESFEKLLHLLIEGFSS